MVALAVLGAACSSSPSHHVATSPTPAASASPAASPTVPAASASPSPTPSGTGAPASPTTVAVSGVTPGHGSPAAAYAGWLDAAVSGQVATECSYALPSQQPNCPQTMGTASITIPAGPITIGATDIVGTQALVVPVGTVCLDGTCLPNTNPNAGIPASPAQFSAEYDQATQTETDPAAGLDEVAGQWYLDLGGPQATTPVV
jgi:hypothetical protein